MGGHRAARAAGLAAACIAVALILTSPAAAAEPSLAADLDGSPIALVEVAQHHCHDFDRPRIHCFRSAAALDDAIAAWTAARSADGTSPSEALATLYVRVYEHQGYQGASLAISSSTTNLGSVGWNDRITSFISIGLAGRFYEHINYAGDVYPFTAYQAVSNIGDAWNDRISSVRVP